jgi:hypothetical protein
MKRLFNPLWIFAVITFPQIILLWLYAESYQIIQTLLTPEHKQYWLAYGIILLVLVGFSSLYATVRLLQRRKIQAGFGWVSLLAYATLLYFYMYDSRQILPWDIPRWMLLKGDLEIYAYTFIMPALLYGLLLLVFYFTPAGIVHTLTPNIAGAVAIPLCWYLGFTVAPLFRRLEELDYFRHLVAIVSIGSIVLFLFFLVRLIYILALQYQTFWTRYDWLWKVPLVVVFPLLGLWLNNYRFEKVFGDFTNEWYYIIALTNGVLLCLPPVFQPSVRLFIFIGRSITYPYIIYFFLVFIPFLPLSVPAILFFGVGVLMLTPLAVAVLQGYMLSQDYQHLKGKFGVILPSIAFVIGMAMLPLYILNDFGQDRQTLHNALDIVYQNKKASLNPNRLQYVLDQVRRHKDTRNNNFMTGNPKGYQPFLTPLYRSLVLENLTLADSKIETLEKIFLGESKTNNNRSGLLPPPTSPDIKIDTLQSESVFHQEGNYWTTWLHLHIENPTTQQFEYRTEFDLPVGTWISNYYLDIEGKREYGLLAERKAATWVYNQIVGQRRDPGILNYVVGNRVSLKVFPMSPKQTRTTGIEFISKNPLQFYAKGADFWIADTTTSNFTQVTEKGGVKLTSALKVAKPDFKEVALHFILDNSIHSAKVREKYPFYVKQITDKLKTEAKIVETHFNFSNYATNHLGNEWQKYLNPKAYSGKGGFWLDNALRRELTDYVIEPKLTHYFYILTPARDKMVMVEPLANIMALAPPNTFVFIQEVGVKGKNVPENLNFTLPQNTHQITLQNPEKYLTPIDLKGTSWDNALTLHAQWLNLLAHPENLEKDWLTVVRNSLQTKILTPYTSYISLENEAQKQALLAKQRQILAAKQALDAGDEPAPMSDPGEWLMILVIVGILVWMKPPNLRRWNII